MKVETLIDLVNLKHKLGVGFNFALDMFNGH